VALDIPISTERLIIRHLEPADAEALFGYRADPVISRYQNWEPVSVEEVRNFIAGLREIGLDTPGRWYQLGLFLRDSGAMAGDCGIHTPAYNPRQAEIGITLAPAFQRRGLATEALRAVLGHLFTTRGRHRVYASVDPANARSLAMLERLGMRREGHLVESLWFKGRWADDVIYALLRREYLAARKP
jgi:RimJ/RimL family protein N-acetyltransferase